jgi:hypothetical protein
VLRAQQKEERERINAKKQAERQRKKTEKENSKKAIQTSQKGKRKALKPPTERQKKQARIEVATEAEVEAQDALARDPSPVRTTRGGRNITLPQKFK